MAAIELNSTSLINDSSLLGYYRLEGNSNYTTASTFGNGSDANITYGIAYGVFGQGASFNGSSSSISTANTYSWDGKTVITVSCWTYLNANPSAYKRIASNAGSNGDNFILGVTNGNNWRWLVNGNDTASVATTVGAWVHLVGTWDGANKRLYVNGVLQQTTAVTGAFSNSTPQKLWLGTSNGDEWYNGYIDDIAVFGRALSSAEVVGLYNGYTIKYRTELNSTSLINDANLVAYYRLEDVTDTKGGTSWTNNNTVTFANSSGIFNKGASFNGSNQTLSLSSPISTATTNVSMTCWVYLPSTSMKGIFYKNGNAASPNETGYGLAVGNTSADNNGNNLLLIISRVTWVNFGSFNGPGWHHVAITRDSTTWRGYIDGVLSATTDTNNPVTPSGGALLGNGVENSTNYYTNCYLDDVSFFSRVLNASEIFKLYSGVANQELNSTELVSDANLKGYYRFEGNSNATTGSNNGTDSNISYGSAYGTFTQGPTFNGSNSKITFGNSSDWNIGTGNVSMSMWVMWLAAPSGAQKCFVVRDVGSGPNNKWLWGYGLITNGNLEFYEEPNKNGVIFSIAHSPVINTWHHYAITRNGGTWTQYYDGAVLTTGSYAGTIVDPSVALTVGYAEGSAYSNYNIDDFSFFNRTLTAKEVYQLYTGTFITDVSFSTNDAFTITESTTMTQISKVSVIETITETESTTMSMTSTINIAAPFVNAVIIR